VTSEAAVGQKRADLSIEIDGSVWNGWGIGSDDQRGRERNGGQGCAKCGPRPGHRGIVRREWVGVNVEPESIWSRINVEPGSFVSFLNAPRRPST